MLSVYDKYTNYRERGNVNNEKKYRKKSVNPDAHNGYFSFSDMSA